MITRNKRKKQEGRPKGTLKKFKFEETKLGFFLKYEVPIVYDLIIKMTPPEHIHEPSYLLVKIICAHSNDSSFKKSKFNRYLSEYLQKGVYCKRAQKLSEKRKLYYESIRIKKQKQFILHNKERLIELIKLKIK